MKTVLTIAGSDCSGGAGIQADIKTICAHKCYAMSAITALTAQNTTGVSGVEETAPEFLKKQLDCIFTDIYPDAVKIGMVASRPLIETIAAAIKNYDAKNVVIDPIMISTSGTRLLSKDAMEAFIFDLLPLGTILTPNIPEAEMICGFPVTTKQHMEMAAKAIAARTENALLVKGGHLPDTADDLLFSNNNYTWFTARRVSNSNTHGTGCTLSSAIACNLAKGLPVKESVQAAKDYVLGALKANLNLGHGSGPLDHLYNLQPSDSSL